MLYCRLIYMLSILCVRLTIKVKVGIPESCKVGWYPPKKLGRITLMGLFLTVSEFSTTCAVVIFSGVKVSCITPVGMVLNAGY